jgi:AcrR family transcriptional regulator
MARRATITDEQILEAARTVFLGEGFNAPTSRIAKLAHISEGSIFKRYATKEALFFAALEIPEKPEWHGALEQASGSGDAKSNLILICVRILDHLNYIMPRIITALGSRMCPQQREAIAGLPETPPVRDQRIIAEYIQREMDLGRLSTPDPQLLARIILGTLVHHAFGLFAAHRDPAPDEIDLLARGTINVLWAGIAPKSTLEAGE